MTSCAIFYFVSQVIIDYLAGSRGQGRGHELNVHGRRGDLCIYAVLLASGADGEQRVGGDSRTMTIVCVLLPQFDCSALDIVFNLWSCLYGARIFVEACLNVVAALRAITISATQEIKSPIL